MSKPFEVELFLHGEQVVRFTWSEDDIRQRATPGRNNHAFAVLHSQSDDERARYRGAAYHLLRVALGRDDDNPFISVVDDDGVWIVPVTSVRSARLSDPEVSSQKRAFGFTADE